MFISESLELCWLWFVNKKTDHCRYKWSQENYYLYCDETFVGVPNSILLIYCFIYSLHWDKQQHCRNSIQKNQHSAACFISNREICHNLHLTICHIIVINSNHKWITQKCAILKCHCKCTKFCYDGKENKAFPNIFELFLTAYLLLMWLCKFDFIFEIKLPLSLSENLTQKHILRHHEKCNCLNNHHKKVLVVYHPRKYLIEYKANVDYHDKRHHF